MEDNNQKKDMTDKAAVTSSKKSKMSMKKMVYYIVGGLLVILLIVLVAVNKKNKKEEMMNQPVQEAWDPDADPNVDHPTAEVVLDENGFAPKSLTIESGTVVIWSNQSGVAASVYSTPASDNSDNPILNLGELASGDKFSLIFDTPGDFKYLNGEDPSQTAEITVTEASMQK